jgi:hypothetical protein
MSNIKITGTGIKDLNYAVKRELGLNAFVETSNNNISQIKLGVYVPELIKDKHTEVSKLKFLEFKDIYNLGITKNGTDTFIKLPEFNEIISILDNKMSSLTLHIEKTLLKNTYEKLLKIPLVHTELTPIEGLLTYLLKNNEITLRDLSHLDKSKLKRYLILLKNREIIQEKEGKIRPGNQLIHFEKTLQKKTDKEIIDKVLASLLESDFAYINEFLRLRAVYSYIKVAIAYYLPSLNNEGLLHFDIPTLIESYFRIYGKRIPNEKITNQTEHLIDVDILSSKEGFIFGNKKLFQRILAEPSR